MRLVEQWRAIEAGLPSDWDDARLDLLVHDASRLDRAAGLLGPLTPGRAGRELRFFCARRGAGPRPDAMRRLLGRLDEERIRGTLGLISSGEAEPSAVPERQTLAAEWDAALATLPPDWSDLYVELELDSSDYLERGALLLAPANPARYGGKPGFRFRSARRFGYGVAAEMARRCLARLDEERITGRLRIVHALSETDPVATQGPVWYLGGKVV
jgi:hypothetical protein